MLTASESVMVERGWFIRQSVKLRRHPKHHNERKVLARMGRVILGRWREAMAAAKAK